MNHWTNHDYQRKTIPNLVGIDIDCGLTLAKIKGKKIEYQKLDTVIRDNIPSSYQIRTKMHHYANQVNLSELKFFSHIREDRTLFSLGSLGGGKHFIVADMGGDGNLFVVIHSGSRHQVKK